MLFAPYIGYGRARVVFWPINPEPAKFVFLLALHNPRPPHSRLATVRYMALRANAQLRGYGQNGQQVLAMAMDLAKVALRLFAMPAGRLPHNRV